MSDSTPSLLTSLSNDLATAVERGAAATVTVNARRRLPASGIVWTGDGLVVTANHVVERDDDITVGLPDGRTANATVVGRDAGSDIAVLRLDATDVAAGVQSAEEIKPGHLVLAIGRPSAGGPMASFGVVSMIGEHSPRGPRGDGRGRGRQGGRPPGPPHGRPGFPSAPFPPTPPEGGPGWGRRGFEGTGAGIERFIRADVAMLPGFSGGPLVTAAGEIAGLNTSLFGRLGGITIPNDVIIPIVDSLLTHGKVRRGFLGVGLQTVRLPEAQATAAGQTEGLLAVNIEADGPADAAGLLIGDILLSIAGSAVTSVESLQESLTGDLIGVDTPVTLFRGGVLTTISVNVGDRA
ncbi:MAG: S1C family serine protease [Thermomicrobiales bacterium]